MKQQHEKALKLLTDNRAAGRAGRLLYEKETITGEEFMAILNKNSETPRRTGASIGGIPHEVHHDTGRHLLSPVWAQDWAPALRA